MVLCPMIGSIIGMVVGALFIIAGLLAYFLIPEAVDKALRERLSVTSPDSENYDAFVNARDGEEDGAGSFVSYTIFNLTNPQAVLAGTEIAKYQPVGPFRYRRRTHRSNVTFPDDGNVANYTAQDEYTFEPLPDAQHQTDTEVNLYSMNPFTVGLVLRTKAVGIQAFLFSNVIKKLFGGSAKEWATVPNHSVNKVPSFAGVVAKEQAENFITADVDASAVFATVADVKEFSFLRYLCGNKNGTNDFQSKYGASWKYNFENDAARDTVCTQLVTYYDKVAPAIMDGLREQNGFDTLAIRYRSAKGILFDVESLFGHSLFQNDTSRGKYYNRAVLTGKNETRYANMGMFITYDNISHIESYPKKYPMRFRVTTVDAFQDSVPGTAEFYYPLIERPFPANKTKEVEVKGITTHQYVVDRAALTKVDPDFNNDIAGVINLAPVKSGVPFYACSPYYDLAEEWRTKVEGVVKPAGYDVDSRVDIEPRTGLGIKGALRVMVLIKQDYSANSEGFDKLEQGKQAPVVLHPIALLEQDQELSDAQADKLRAAVKDSEMAATAIMASLCSFGGILIIVFFTCFIVVCVRPKEEQPGNKE